MVFDAGHPAALGFNTLTFLKVVRWRKGHGENGFLKEPGTITPRRAGTDFLRPFGGR